MTPSDLMSIAEEDSVPSLAAEPIELSCSRGLPFSGALSNTVTSDSSANSGALPGASFSASGALPEGSSEVSISGALPATGGASGGALVGQTLVVKKRVRVQGPADPLYRIRDHIARPATPTRSGALLILYYMSVHNFVPSVKLYE